MLRLARVDCLVGDVDAVLLSELLLVVSELLLDGGVQVRLDLVNLQDPLL